MGYNMTYCNCPVCGASAEYDSASATVYCQSCIRQNNEKRRKAEQTSEVSEGGGTKLKITRCHGRIT